MKVALLGGAMLIAAVNLLWTRPRLQASASDRPDFGAPAALLRRLVGGEVLVAASSSRPRCSRVLPPPAKALAKVGEASARSVPGR